MYFTDPKSELRLMIRQKYVEDAVRTAIAELDPGALRAQVKLVRFNESKESEYPVVATLEHQGKTFEISWYVTSNMYFQGVHLTPHIASIW